VGRRTAWRNTERFGRELDRPARVLAASEAVQGESGPADRNAIQAMSGELPLGCIRDDEPQWYAFARITRSSAAGGWPTRR
jgi:hypothetical protein